MKKLWWLLAVFALATGVKQVFDHFGPMAQGFRAYRAEAKSNVEENDPRFESIEGNIIDVSHRLESADRDPDGAVRLVVVQAVQFQKFSESGPFGNRRVAETRQRVTMRSIDGRWVISDLQEERTEVTDLSAVTSRRSRELVLSFGAVMKEIPCWLLAGAPLAFSVVLAAGQEEMRSVQSGVFTAEQAERGGTTFEKSCRNCHELDAFADGVYLEGWSGQTADAMIDQIRETMPEDSPGNLKRTEYVDIAAFFFQLNGLPTGDSEMDVTNVKTIRIEGPYRGATGRFISTLPESLP